MRKKNRPPKETSEGTSEATSEGTSEGEARRRANLQQGVPEGCYRATDGRIRRLEAVAAPAVGEDGEGAQPAEDIDFDAPEVLKAMNRVMLTEEDQDRTPLQRSLRKLYENDFAKFMDLYNRREAAEDKRLSVLGPAVEGPDPGTQKARALINELLDSFYQKHPEMKK